MANFIKELSQIDGNIICYNLDELTKFTDSVINDFKSIPNVKFYFAIKANGNARVLDVMAQKGLGADCASLAEIELAKKMHFSEISVTCPGFNGEEIKSIVGQNIHFDFDNMGQLLDANLYNETVGIRINPELYDSRFGFNKTDLPRQEYLETHRINIDTLHVHYGNKNIENFVGMVQFIMDLLEKEMIFRNISKLNVGGGIEQFYIDGKSYEFKNLIKELINQVQRKLGKPIKILIEPGTLFSLPIGYVKGNAKYLYSRNVYLNFSFFNLAEWNSLNIIAQNGHFYINKSKKYTYRFYGNTCLEEDALVLSCSEKVNKNDSFIFFPVGAYNYNLIRNLHSMPPPPIVYFINGKFDYE